MAVNISIASAMGLVITPPMSVTLPSTVAKDAHTMNTRKDLARVRSKDLNTIIKEKIDEAFSCQEKKGKADLNKFEALSISSGNKAGHSDSESRVSSISKEGTDSE
eukprot:2972083-Ditylum_brightwellii.AAC.1